MKLYQWNRNFCKVRYLLGERNNSVIVCYLRAAAERESEIDSRFQLLHKYTTSAFKEQKPKYCWKNYEVSLSSRGKIFNGRNRISRRALGNNARNHERVITWNQHLISMFFILVWLWLSINSLDVQKILGCCTHAELYLNSWMARPLLWEDAEMGYFLSRNIIFAFIILT